MSRFGINVVHTVGEKVDPVRDNYHHFYLTEQSQKLQNAEGTFWFLAVDLSGK